MASGMDFVDRAEEIVKARAPKAITTQTFSILSQSARLALWTRDEDLFRRALRVTEMISAHDEAGIVEAIGELSEALQLKQADFTGKH